MLTGHERIVVIIIGMLIAVFLIGVITYVPQP